jgi:hypothetical protein
VTSLLSKNTPKQFWKFNARHHAGKTAIYRVFANDFLLTILSRYGVWRRGYDAVHYKHIHAPLNVNNLFKYHVFIMVGVVGMSFGKDPV